jgi:hypothetical protein
MDEEGIPGEVEVVKVETEEQARELRFVALRPSASMARKLILPATLAML